MKNLFSKLNNENNSGEIKIGEKFDIYVSAKEMNLDVKEDCFVLLDGVKGIFKVGEIYRIVNSPEYKIQIVRENYPKNYSKNIERIDNYTTKED